ncbi:3-keto-disaccharide hydrolase [Sunxiuqinia sp. A32]|uniref:3-keto-disaccharide hydrolase n=1 Tax=Sunxiuqinia sp. A32 TaxID=3461496 RepID=UPI0040463C0C
MKKHLILPLFVLATFASFSQVKLKPIFNGSNLKNWDFYIGTALKNHEDLKAKATPENVFSVVEEQGEQVLRIAGNINASIATKKAYENYHFRMEYKWGDEVFTSRNSGLLYHSYGPFGAGIGTWMSSIEFQLMHGNLGDAYMMADTYAEIQVSGDDANKNYSPNGEKMNFGNDQNGGKIAHKQKDMEKPVGEWNVLDLYCFGQKAYHVVNGELVMVCNNTSKIIDGKISPLSKGKIQIQSEGGELFIRKAEIGKIKSLPDSF